MDYPGGMSEELAARLYGTVKVPWSDTPFAFDPDRGECQEWMTAAMENLPLTSNYTRGSWPRLVNVIRRGENNAIRVFQWSNGLVYEQET
jgi:hypothetical protein